MSCRSGPIEGYFLGFGGTVWIESSGRPDNPSHPEAQSDADRSIRKQDLMEWYYGKNGQQHGPVSMDVIRQLIAGGQLLGQDLAWREGMSEWQPVHSIPELTSHLPTQAPPIQAPPPATPVPPPTMATPVPPAYSAQPVPFNTQGTPTNPAGSCNSGMASASLVLAIFGLFCGGLIFGILAIVFASIAHGGMRRCGNIEGKGMATAGLIIEIVDIVFAFSFHHHHMFFRF